MIQSDATDMYIDIRWMAQAEALHLEEKESSEWTQVKVCSYFALSGASFCHRLPDHHDSPKVRLRHLTCSTEARAAQ